MLCVAPEYSQTSCFNIPLESALYKLQNAIKKSKIWEPLWICDDVNSIVPPYIIYDNACNLRAFCLAGVDNSERTKLFKERILVVDKLHYQGHVCVNCAKYCDPNLYPSILPLTLAFKLCDSRTYQQMGWKTQTWY